MRLNTYVVTFMALIITREVVLGQFTSKATTRTTVKSASNIVKKTTKAMIKTSANSSSSFSTQSTTKSSNLPTSTSIKSTSSSKSQNISSSILPTTSMPLISTSKSPSISEMSTTKKSISSSSTKSLNFTTFLTTSKVNSASNSLNTSIFVSVTTPKMNFSSTTTKMFNTTGSNYVSTITGPTKNSSSNSTTSKPNSSTSASINISTSARTANNLTTSSTGKSLNSTTKSSLSDAMMSTVIVKGKLTNSPSSFKNKTTQKGNSTGQTTPSVVKLLASCPPNPSISAYIIKIEEKCMDVNSRARDYYVDHVGITKSLKEFEGGLRKRIEPDYVDCKKTITESRESLRKTLKLSESNFKEAYWNSGFLESPSSCFNKVVMGLRLEEEKMLSYVEESISQAIWLFDYNLNKTKT